jgi:hypothetical protein
MILDLSDAKRRYETVPCFLHAVYSQSILTLKIHIERESRSLGKMAILVFPKNVCHKNTLEAHNILIGLAFCHHGMSLLQPAAVGNHQRRREATNVLNKQLKL